MMASMLSRRAGGLLQQRVMQAQLVRGRNAANAAKNAKNAPNAAKKSHGTTNNGMSRVKQYSANAAKVALLFNKADWCPHCKAAKPEIDRAAQILGTVVPVYAVDSERDAVFQSKIGVQAFPTIMFRDARGKLTEYSGAMDGRAIADWTCAQSGMCGQR